MQPGDIIICRGPHGYNFTGGKEYVVIKYEPEYYEFDARFTWPAYVTVEDDYGKKVVAHAIRFTPKEQP